jgi:hypothetical protein
MMVMVYAGVSDGGEASTPLSGLRAGAPTTRATLAASVCAACAVVATTLTARCVSGTGTDRSMVHWECWTATQTGCAATRSG